ncbi:MAG: SDR family NAD(P)-dependent oxidoreductase [Ignavibacteriaceae bacterium]|nr:SDR family NAD(P)-dependent oxidoreductase [Ignavibacteriaceae bacterium]
MSYHNQIPPTHDMRNKIVLITGSTDGIGQQTAIELARMGAKVIIHGRTETKALETVAQLSQRIGKGELDWVGGEFTSFSEVKKMAEEINNRYDKLDVLINNAGVYKREKIITTDGFETTFQVNHLSHFLLTNLLLDILQKAEHPKVIVVSSVAHMRAKLDFKNLNAEKSFDAYGQYAVSKLANILFAKKLSYNLNGTAVKVNSLHPGVIKTKLLSQGFELSGSKVQFGASIPTFLAADPHASEINGQYFSKHFDLPVLPSEDAMNEKYQKKMWDMSEKLTGYKAPKKTRKKKAEA